jgi:hypothetical protein
MSDKRETGNTELSAFLSPSDLESRWKVSKSLVYKIVIRLAFRRLYVWGQLVRTARACGSVGHRSRSGSGATASEGGALLTFCRVV